MVHADNNNAVINLIIVAKKTTNNYDKHNDIIHSLTSHKT